MKKIFFLSVLFFALIGFNHSKANCITILDWDYLFTTKEAWVAFTDSCPGSGNYVFQVSLDPNFSSVLGSKLGTTTVLRFDLDYVCDTTLYYRVGRFYTPMNISWSTARTFDTTLSPPTPLQGNLECNSASLNWGPSSKGCYYYEFSSNANFSSLVSSGNTCDTAVTFSGLTPAPYWFRVRSTFENCESEWTTKSLTITNSNISSIYVTDIEYNSFIAHWVESSSACFNTSPASNFYKLEVKKSSNNWSTQLNGFPVTTDLNSHTINSLQHNTSYDLRVSAHTSNGNSEPVVLLNVMTLPSSGRIGGSQSFDLNTNIGSIEIFPNPAISEFGFKTESNFLDQSDVPDFNYSVIDSSGRLVFSGTSEIDMTVDVSHLHAGIYFVDIEHVDYKTTKRLIIK